MSIDDAFILFLFWATGFGTGSAVALVAVRLGVREKHKKPNQKTLTTNLH
jgi:uncharacterized protein YoaH (UPF0181 family)